MKTNILIIYCLIAMTMQASQPSFNCSKATTEVEKRICKSDVLAKEDTKLSKLYFSVLKNTQGSVKKQIQNEQREWLTSWSDACNYQKLTEDKFERCILNRYKKRNFKLSGVTFDSAIVPSSNEILKILRITPKGKDVPASRQVVIQFDRPVVPIGRMERKSEDIPVEISPQLNCEWRWLNNSALACQLRDEDVMKQAIKYSVTVNKGLKTVEGIGMVGSYTSEFITSRPKVSYTRFVNWLTPGTPLIQVTFNMPVTKSSVQNVMNMQARRVMGSKKVKIIAYADSLKRVVPFWLDKNQKLHVDDKKTEVNGEIARKVWMVEPREELPSNQTIWFDIKSGLISSIGDQEGIENSTIVSFETYPEFKFLGIRCTLSAENNTKNILYEQLLKTPRELKECSPLKPLSLIFSSPVKSSMVKNSVNFSPALDGGRKDYNPWENTRDWTRLTSAHRKNRTYQVWLPELLQAYQEYNISIDANSFVDEFGRKLQNGNIDFSFYTAHREPRLRLLHNNAVLETGVDSELPLYVTNLNSVVLNYQSLDKQENMQKNIVVKKAEDISYKMPLGLREILGNKSGVISGTLTPNPKPANYWRDPKLFAQVTPFQVHAKIGHFNSLVWISDFAKGKPVSSAKVTLYKGTYGNLPQLEKLPYSSVSDKDGLVKFPGTQKLDPELDMFSYWINDNKPRLFIKVEKDGDIALLPLDSRFKVRSNGTYASMRKYGQHAHAWGTTAQGVYKLGDKVKFKIYVRDQSNTNWVSPKKDGYTLSVYDPQRKLIYKIEDISLNKFGAFDGEFIVPASGTTGQYNFTLNRNNDAKTRTLTWKPMSVLVSDFTPSPFKVKTELNGKIFKSNDEVTVSSIAMLHSGGAFSNAELRLTARLKTKSFSSNSPLAKGFNFGSRSATSLSSSKSKLLDFKAILDDKGEYTKQFKLPKTDIYYGSILVESAVKDERGKFVASNTSADFSGRTRFVGLKNTSWIYNKNKKSGIDVLVVDDKGEPVANTDVRISIEHRVYKASRVKGAGNAYLTQNIMTWEKESECLLKSSLEVAKCEFIPKNPGYYQFIANIKDTNKQEHKIRITAWVTGSGHVVWNQSNDATLQIIPQQNSYKIGDKARYLVKNPFPGAKALVSIERYGVIDSWVQTLEGSTPVIEVPIKPEYLPGFYISVVVVSPRVEKPMGKNKVDLGKPSYKMGYIRTIVSDPDTELSIQIKTDKEVYKPRDKVKVKIKIDTKDINKDEAFEVAIAVIDESVLALNKKGNTYYNPYRGFNRLDNLDLNNYSLISRLIGRQKFEKKGANPGGDGGATAYSQLRDLFKYVTYWNPSVELKNTLETEVEFEVPDNLTGWRVLAFVVNKDEKMGLGTKSFKVNRPTEIRPVMPNQLLEGDSFKAGFNVMNRSDKKRNISILVKVSGALKQSVEKSFDLELKAYERKNIWIPLQTSGAGELIFKASGGDDFDKDAVEHKIKVNKKRSLETAATYGTTLQNNVSEWVQIPDGIHTDVGKVGVVLSPSVIGNIDGAFKYLQNYPYFCWEQRLTKAVAASRYIELNEYLKDSVKWSEAKELVIKTMQDSASFQAPNGGMTYWVGSNSHVSPYLSAYTALAFQWLEKDGYIIQKQVQQKLHKYLLNMLRHNELPSFYSKGMSSTVRAVALNALSQAGELTDTDIERYHKYVPQMDLFGKAHYLQASVQTKGVADSIRNETLDSILGHASQSGGKFQFNEEWDDSYSYILATPLRSNCAILSALLQVQKDSTMSKKVGDIPYKMVRSITQSRGNRDHWENTQENLFCLNSIVDYARVYESQAPSMKLDVKFDNENIGKTNFSKISDSPVKIFRELKATDAGKKAKIEIDKQGVGRVYYSAQISYDLKAENSYRINSGIELRREYSIEKDGKFVILKSPMQIKRSDLIKVDLFISVPTARHFVVVHDPVPGGLEPINSNLATSSIIDANKGDFEAAKDSWWFSKSDWSYYGRYFWSFYHKELKHDAANFYADYLPAGNYHLSYTAQAIAEGSFKIMPAMAEEMYDPDIYGKSLPMKLEVGR